MKERILIVEDETIIAHDISKSVKKYGFEVCAIVHSGDEAIELLRSGIECDLILMDIFLGDGIDGIDTYSQIKNFRHLPLIYLTSATDFEILNRAKLTSPYGYITKPATEINIFTSIETALYKFSAERSMIDQQQWHTAMLNGIGEGIISVNIDGQITYMNHVAEKITGFTAEEAIGKLKNDVFPKKRTAESIHTLKISESTKGHLIVNLNNFYIKRKNGDYVPVDINNSAIISDEGDITGTIFSLRDISDRLKTDKLIKRAIKEWKSTFDALTDCVFLIDELFRVIRCNSSAARFLNRQYPEIIGLFMNDIFPVPEDMWTSGVDTLKNLKQTFHCEGLFKDRWYYIQADPIVNEHETLSGAVVVISDITDSKRVQEELARYRNDLEEQVKNRTKQLEGANADLRNEISLRWLIAEQLVQLKEVAEAANRSKSEFLANMSHELRTPLNSIIGFARLIQMGVDKGDEEIYLANIIKSGTHLLGMINDILNLSKMEAGKLRLDRVPCDLYESLVFAVDIMSIHAEQKHIALTIIKEFDVSPPVFADPKRMQQIFINLITNAIKFTPEGGSVRVILRKNETTMFADVIDTGIGIEKKKMSILFEKFVQLDSSMSKQNEGTGLGLAITKMLVELHDGHIYVESEVNKGSTFSFSVPLFNQAIHEESISANEEYPEDARKKEILYINTSNLQITKAVEFFAANRQLFSVKKRNELSASALADREYLCIIVETDEDIENESKMIETIKRLNKAPLVSISRSYNKNYEEFFLGLGYDLFYTVPVNFMDIIKDLVRNGG